MRVERTNTDGTPLTTPGHSGTSQHPGASPGRKEAEADGPRLLAVSDTHVAMADNRTVLETFRPETEGDWLIVAGDVAEMTEDISWALRLLSERFEKVIWAPGNHELWTVKDDPVQLRGQARYEYLVKLCRDLGIVTPEDPYPLWEGPGGPAVIAPLFLLYDYSFHAPGTSSKEESLAYAHETGVVCSDEFMLHPDPYATRDAWCHARVKETEERLAACDPSIPLVLVNHFPLVRQPTDVLYFPEFAQWCGTVRTADWHTRFNTAAVVYGHLHIPRTTWYDGIRFEEVSIGYPREWRRWGGPKGLRRVLPYPEAAHEEGTPA
ncbi:metallophosphoesterase [Streptomyces sp. AJS327]|uniref:metallophosphoesterase family protein n=1 Tax=Streptomyces sp. AJS327 TaxID=2545265 RepID=UPI0015E0253A|nr:metallophosphoesterase [Streptomyces sp. AJS327]MBA0053601.1 metallophosphoesterase [Streptomyces sp. AJS327]